MGFENAAYRDYFTKNWDRHLATMQNFLRQPCIPSDGVGCRESAELLMEYYRALGCQEVTLLETPTGNPGVFAYLDSGAEQTLINYCMLDTKPAYPDGWDADPFAAEIVDKPPYGKVILARGAQGRKAPYISWLNALEAVKAIEGKLPLNIIFLAESEENLGSPNYKSFFEKYKDRLATASFAFCPGAVQSASGQVKITQGYKGLINVRFTCSGKLWGKGPQNKATHAMAHSLIESPTWRLVCAMASMKDPVTERILVKDFYADDQPVSDAERAAAQRLVDGFPGKHWKEFLPGVGTDVKSANDGLSNVDATLKYWYSPSFNINGLASGFTGPGTEVFRLPHEAWCQCDIRIPRGYSAKNTIERIQRHLVENGFADIEMKVTAAYEPYQTALDSKLLKSFTDILDEENIPWTVWPFVGGGGPWSLFAELGMPVVFDAGIGFGAGAGAVNEFLAVEKSANYAGILEAELFFAEFIKRLGA